MSDLKGKTVVVTGASGRLGQRVVKAFAEGGATVIALVENIELAQDIPFPDDAEGWAFPADLSKDETVSALFKRMGTQFDRIDAVVHTVGMWNGAPLTETSWEDWRTMMQVTLDSTFLVFREAARIMENQDDGGCLIAIASRQGLERGVAEQPGYSAAKAGVVRLVEAVGAEYAQSNIRAHAIAPSTIVFDGKGDGIPADDLVARIVWLCTDGAYLNGETLRAYGNG